mgnify:CR=1 FL=1
MNRVCFSFIIFLQFFSVFSCVKHQDLLSSLTSFQITIHQPHTDKNQPLDIEQYKTTSITLSVEAYDSFGKFFPYDGYISIEAEPADVTHVDNAECVYYQKKYAIIKPQ